MLEKLRLSKKLLRELDYGVLITSIIIVLFSCLNIYSATFRKSGIVFVKLQLMWLLLGLGVVYVILLIDYNLIINYTPIFYWAGIGLLVLNDTILGSTHKGASSWIAIGSSRAIQPSEFAKIGMILMLAKVIDEIDGKINEPKNFFKVAFYAIVPMVLIVIQPDMGMTMVSFFIALGIFFAAGLSMKVILGGFGGITAIIAIIWNSPLMKPYWRLRLKAFINPAEYTSGMSFQLDQSKMAIGSGKIAGEGFTKGLQIASSNVPEAHTDFIFAVVGNEWGFLGAVFLVLLYGLLIYRFIYIARNSKDLFGSMVVVGVVSSFLFSILQNIGMTIGLMPITGITLQLMSYGGSSMITSFIAIGLVLNIGMRRKKINF